MLKFILDRISEPSTWRGLVWIATALGLVLSPEQKEAIVTAGMTIAGLIGVFTNDKAKPTTEQIDKVKELIQQKVDEAVINSEGKHNENPTDDNFFNDGDVK